LTAITLLDNSAQGPAREQLDQGPPRRRALDGLATTSRRSSRDASCWWTSPTDFRPGPARIASTSSSWATTRGSTTSRAVACPTAAPRSPGLRAW